MPFSGNGARLPRCRKQGLPLKPHPSPLQSSASSARVKVVGFEGMQFESKVMRRVIGCVSDRVKVAGFDGIHFESKITWRVME